MRCTRMVRRLTLTSVVLLSFTTVFTSCGPEEKFKAQLEDINDYQTKLDSVEKVLHSIDFDSLKNVVASAAESEKIVKKIYDSDTLDEEFARAITEFKGIRKNMSKPENKLKVFQEEIDALKNQFTVLEKDIKNGALSEEEVKKYTEREMKDSQLFFNEFKKFYDNTKIVFEVYETYNPKVQKTIKILKEKNEASTS